MGFVLFLVRVLFRRTWAAVVAIFVLGSALVGVSGESSLIAAIPVLVAVGLFVFVWFRFGFLALAVSAFFFFFLVALPITWHSVWYSWIGLTGTALLLALGLYAFHTSLGGQPLFGRASLED